MCGIVGYIGHKNLKSELIENLKRLEYRGYDSSGIACITDNQIVLHKSVGKIQNLDDKITEKIDSTCGIGHTRWATHGKSTEVNAHPHISEDKKWAVVHNGIIENYQELKNELIEKYKTNFTSETDTEIIPHLLEVNESKNSINKVISVCQKLKGSYALAIINADEDNTIYLAKQKSPLYISTLDSNVYIASDPICFAGKTDTYYALDDGEFCKVTMDKIVFFDSDSTIIDKKSIELDNITTNAGKENYPHFMLKEIMETKDALQRIVKTYSDNEAFNKLNSELLSTINKIVIIGCGTAYHAGLMGAKYIEKFARIDCRVYVASEFRYTSPMIDKNTLCIFVSQSGETADTLSCCTLAKEMGAKTLALTNVLYSTLAKSVDITLPVCAGPEIAVASTKAYTCQIAIFYMIARHLSNIKFKLNFDYLSQIKSLSENISIPTQKDCDEYAEILKDTNRVFFLGRDFDYISSEEASLKLKEIAYIDCYAHPSGELKHGFLALVDSETIVFVLATQKDLLEKTLNGAHESQARGGKIILVSQLDIESNMINSAYKYFKLPNFDEELMPIVSIGFFQMVSYLTSVKRNINPDQPRNLAKSVTVE